MAGVFKKKKERKVFVVMGCVQIFPGNFSFMVLQLALLSYIWHGDGYLAVFSCVFCPNKVMHMNWTVLNSKLISVCQGLYLSSGEGKFEGDKPVSAAVTAEALESRILRIQNPESPVFKDNNNLFFKQLCLSCLSAVDV